MERVNLLESANQLRMMGTGAMQLGDYRNALHLLSMGLHQLQSLNCPPHDAAPFLMDQAECFWRLGDIQAALHKMGDAINHGLPNSGNFAKVIILDIV